MDHDVVMVSLWAGQGPSGSMVLFLRIPTFTPNYKRLAAKTRVEISASSGVGGSACLTLPK